jgi:hypothetical protein
MTRATYRFLAIITLLVLMLSLALDPEWSIKHVIIMDI